MSARDGCGRLDPSPCRRLFRGGEGERAGEAREDLVEARGPACKLGQRAIARSACDVSERDLADVQILGHGGPRRHVAAFLQCAKKQAGVDEILKRWTGTGYGLPPLTAQGRAVTVEPVGELLLMSDDCGAVEHELQPLPQRTWDALIPADEPADQNPRKRGANPLEGPGERVGPSGAWQDGLDGEEGRLMGEVARGARDEDDNEPRVLAAELVQPGDQFGASLFSAHDEDERARPGRRFECAPGRNQEGVLPCWHEAEDLRLVPGIDAVHEQGRFQQTAWAGSAVVLVPMGGVHKALSVRSAISTRTPGPMLGTGCRLAATWALHALCGLGAHRDFT